MRVEAEIGKDVLDPALHGKSVQQASRRNSFVCDRSTSRHKYSAPRATQSGAARPPLRNAAAAPRSPRKVRADQHAGEERRNVPLRAVGEAPRPQDVPL